MWSSFYTEASLLVIPCGAFEPPCRCFSDRKPLACLVCVSHSYLPLKTQISIIYIMWFNFSPIESCCIFFLLLLFLCYFFHSSYEKSLTFCALMLMSSSHRNTRWTGTQGLGLVFGLSLELRTMPSVKRVFINDRWKNRWMKDYISLIEASVSTET